MQLGTKPAPSYFQDGAGFIFRIPDTANSANSQHLTEQIGKHMIFMPLIIFTVAAILEVGGDALIRKGLRGGTIWIVIAGFLILGSYGVVVNMVKWDFSRLLGVYVAVFAVVSVLSGHFVFEEQIPLSTRVGLGIIVIGGVVIQMGPHFK